MNFVSGQVDFQLTCPDGQIEILEKYQKFPDLPLILNVCYVVTLSLSSSFPSGQIKFGVVWMDGQVEHLENTNTC